MEKIGLTAKEAAQFLGCHLKHVYRLASMNRITAYRFCGTRRVLFKKDELEKAAFQKTRICEVKTNG